MATIQELLDKVSALLGRRTLTQNEEANWWAGTATGGPNGNGTYPRTDANGTVRMIPSPGAIAALAGQGGGGTDMAQVQAAIDAALAELDPGLSAASVTALPGAAAGTAAPQIPGVAPDGTLKKYTLDLFASRRTRDLAATVQLLGDEILPTYSAQLQAAAGNGDRGTPVGAIAALIQGVLNPKLTYGAKGDGKLVYDASTTAGSNVVESLDGQFAPTDFGKLLILSNAQGYYILQSTITQYIDTKHVRIAATATTTFSNQRCIWGTDDTVALQSWLDALAGPGKYTFGRVGVLPEGIFLTRPLKYAARMGIRGSSRSGTALALIPGGSNQGINSAVLANLNDQVDFPIIQNLTILGNRYLVGNATGGLRFVSVAGGSTLPQVDPHPYFSDIDIYEPGGYAFFHGNRGAGIAHDIQMRGSGYYGFYSAGYDMTYSNITAAGNAFTGLFFSPNGSANNQMSNWYSYFNGVSPYAQNTGAAKDPTTNINWSDACNVFLSGGNNELGFGRAQESWGPNVVIDGQRCRLIEARCDDTGCVRPNHGLGGTSLMSVRAAIMFPTANAVKNIVRGVYVNTAVHPGSNYATHAVFFSGNSSSNRVSLDEEIGIAAYSAARTGTDSSGGYQNNVVRINDAAVIN